MNRRDALLTAGAAALAIPLATPASAARLISVGVTEHSSLPRNRPDWPVPNEPNQIMYMQRSMNSNTVVWTALFNSAGVLADPPATAYWRRYNDSGERKSLDFKARWAFGVNSRPSSQPGRYTVTARVLPQFPFVLVQTGAGRAQSWCQIGGRSVLAHHVFIAMQGELRATDMFAYGRDPRSGTYLREHFRIEGGILG